MLGKLVHLGFDALLISAFLAGVKRTTGLTFVHNASGSSPFLISCFTRPALYQIPNKDIRQVVGSWLEAGEYVFDFAVVFFGRSSSFERKR
ncbi:hypothetical protein EST38_g9856 [Candolleomyces aberdarensis]|uniref:DUF1748-domain-containing protein n=1 Tax=Candolleomyces aberdarensis TaxID=2316362 RepID=A0A4Q2D9K0_9AGAR|nr:hypothetical protein EST38_g9856 [Candolleomyces aberdarensis]